MNNKTSTIRLIAVGADCDAQTRLNALKGSHTSLKLISSYQSVRALKTQLGTLSSFDILLIFDIEVLAQLHILRLIKQVRPNIGILLFHPALEIVKLLELLSCGVNGYILPTTKTVDIVNTIVELSHSITTSSSKIACKNIDYFQCQPSTASQPELTWLEQQIADAFVKGMSYTQMTTKLSITLESLRYHTKKIYAKFGVHSKIQLIATLNKA